MTRRRMSLAIIFTFLGALALGGLQVSSNAARPGRAATGGLRLTFQPYAGKGHEDMPVEVLKFVVDVQVTRPDDTMWVHEWRLQSRAHKEIVTIRRALFVYSESEPQTLLLRHPLVGLGHVRLVPGQDWPRGKCSGPYYCPNGFAMLSVADLLKPIVKDAEPEGNYLISLGIDKVWFADGTIWEFGATKDN